MLDTQVGDRVLMKKKIGWQMAKGTLFSYRNPRWNFFQYSDLKKKKTREKQRLYIGIFFFPCTPYPISKLARKKTVLRLIKQILKNEPDFGKRSVVILRQIHQMILSENVPRYIIPARNSHLTSYKLFVTANLVTLLVGTSVIMIIREIHIVLITCVHLGLVVTIILNFRFRFEWKKPFLKYFLLTGCLNVRKSHEASQII